MLLEASHILDQLLQIPFGKQDDSSAAFPFELLGIMHPKTPSVHLDPSRNLLGRPVVLSGVSQNTLNDQSHAHRRFQLVAEQRRLHVRSVMDHVAACSPSVLQIAVEQSLAVVHLSLFTLRHSNLVNDRQ